MSRAKVFLLGFLLMLAALAAGLYAGWQTALDDAAEPKIGPAAINSLFSQTFADTAGVPMPMANWKGKTLVVNFWASWCPPCREEMPGFSRLQQQYAGKDVQFVGIALDRPEPVRAFAQAAPVSYPLVLGGETGASLAAELGNSALALPYTLVISPAGEVTLARFGLLDEHTLGAHLLRSLPR